MTIHDRLNEWKKITDAATGGPWKFTGSVLLCREGNIPETKENGNFIAISRTAMPKLIQALEVAVVFLREISNYSMYEAKYEVSTEALSQISKILEVEG